MSSRKFWIILATAALFIAGCADKTPTVTKKTVEETSRIVIKDMIHV